MSEGSHQPAKGLLLTVTTASSGPLRCTTAESRRALIPRSPCVCSFIPSSAVTFSRFSTLGLSHVSGIMTLNHMVNAKRCLPLANASQLVAAGAASLLQSVITSGSHSPEETRSCVPVMAFVSQGAVHGGFALLLLKLCG